jgi:hypothetical protein
MRHTFEDRSRVIRTSPIVHARVFTVLATTAAIVLGACSSGSKDTSRTPRDSALHAAAVTAAASSTAEARVDSAASATMPPALASVAEFGENIYDAAMSRSWTSSRAMLDSLYRSELALRPLLASRPSSEATRLPLVIDSLRQALTARNRDAALETSNRVTYLAAQMSAAYHPQPPAEIALLDYFGRELQVWSAQGNQARLTETAAAIRRTWGSVRSDVVQHGGSVAAARMDTLVTHVASAKTPAEYALVATPILDHVDVLESVYAKP